MRYDCAVGNTSGAVVANGMLDLSDDFISMANPAHDWSGTLYP